MAEKFLTLMGDLDSASQELMSGWYKELEAAGFTGSQTKGLPYHISLSTFPLECEHEAAELTSRIASEFGPVPVHISHIGIFSGGRVVFGAPERNAALDALHDACRDTSIPWTPHATILIDEPEAVTRAMPIIIDQFKPFMASITRLHLCAFWPTREILSVPLAGSINNEENADSNNTISRDHTAEREGMTNRSVLFGNENDIDSWMALVRLVRENFPGLETEKDLEAHRETVLRFMQKRQALCVKSGDEIIGVLLFSRKRNMICCLAVHPEMRRKGAASELLKKAISELDRKCDITVSTFRAGDEKGIAPRALYEKFGFKEGALTAEFGYPNQVFVLSGEHD